MAEAFARRRFDERGLDIGVSSCGLLESDREVPGEIGTLMEARGLDVWGHRSRTMTAEMLMSASLILGMERLHVREAATLAPQVFDRTFTLPELVRRIEEFDATPDADADVSSEAHVEAPGGSAAAPATNADPEPEPKPERPVDLDGWLALFATTRTRRELLGRDGHDEVADPYGRSRLAYTLAADEIDDLIRRLISGIWPDAEVPETGEPTASVLTGIGASGIDLPRPSTRERTLTVLRGLRRRTPSQEETR